tara:strand:+ start:7565 stop:8431 length:867 start_codon:yes stop_codon:yes gene_type:complete
MTKIHLVTVDSGWILQKIAERIAAELSLICDVSLGQSPREDVDSNFYIDVGNCYSGPTSTIDIGYFTHLHEDSPRHLQQKWLSLNYIFHHGLRYYNIFKDYYPENQMSIVLPGEIPTSFGLKKPTLGIFQRGGHEGKGHFFMKDMASHPITKEYKFLFVGKDWEEISDIYAQEGIEAEHIINEDYENYPSLYNKIDYLLVPSLWEGGPMAIFEAYAKGIPVISSHVGWMGNDIRVDYLFSPGNKKQLAEILNEIQLPSKRRRERVAKYNYKFYAKKLLDTVLKIKEIS